MITKQSKTLFLVLIIVHLFHAIEEYFGKIWTYFIPADRLGTEMAKNLEYGFILLQSGLFLFGLWISIFALKNNYPYAKYLVWFWIVLDLLYGIAHPIIALSQWELVPGLITAPALFLLAFTLAKSMCSKLIYCIDHN